MDLFSINYTRFPYRPPQSPFQDCPAAKMWHPNTPMSEDCLFLNIWVPTIQPSTEDSATNEKLAVMQADRDSQLHFYLHETAYNYTKDLVSIT
ncbi:uncharacterized protein DEA37_0012235 [Paragonimus westermani]|uniref:Uncharacterized protein n=1 Tax=Paragonimus westermani TaxID=34504 RepID=A0A5J4N683_9TREM|nr:uncharacterized protein DEA37_0012235 [Paragonimus westermani]